MAGRDLVRATFRSGFRAYFAACMPSGATTVMQEEANLELAARQRQRRRRTPRMPWGYRSTAQSPKPLEEEAPIRAFYANICEGPIGECSICFETMEIGERIISLNCCDTTVHTFHEDCILKWFKQGNNTCPLCRVKVI